MHRTITAYVEEIAFKATLADLCVFTRIVKNQYIYLSLHVDDFLCVETKTNCQSTKAMLEKQFKLKSTKDIIHLDINITQARWNTIDVIETLHKRTSRSLQCWTNERETHPYRTRNG
jgi:hypothetical protein